MGKRTYPMEEIKRSGKKPLIMKERKGKKGTLYGRKMDNRKL